MFIKLFGIGVFLMISLSTLKPSVMYSIKHVYHKRLFILIFDIYLNTTLSYPLNKNLYVKSFVYQIILIIIIHVFVSKNVYFMCSKPKAVFIPLSIHTLSGSYQLVCAKSKCGYCARAAYGTFLALPHSSVALDVAARRSWGCADGRGRQCH